jgi:hypothetical protein
MGTRSGMGRPETIGSHLIEACSFAPRPVHYSWALLGPANFGVALTALTGKDAQSPVLASHQAGKAPPASMLWGIGLGGYVPCKPL